MRSPRRGRSAGPCPRLIEFLDRAGHVLDRHLRVDAVLVVEIDAVGPEALQRVLDHLLDVLRPAVEAARPSMSKPNLVAIDDLVAERRERFADELFVRVRAVDLGGVEERDAFFVGGADDLDALASVCGRSVVGADAHAPGTQFRDFQLPSFRVFMGVLIAVLAPLV